MNINIAEIRRIYKVIYGIELSSESFIGRCMDIIKKIKILVDLTSQLKMITINVVNGLSFAITKGYFPHDITKEKIKISIDVLENLAKLEALNKEQQNTAEMLAALARRVVEANPYIPSDKFQRYR